MEILFLRALCEFCLDRQNFAKQGYKFFEYNIWYANSERRNKQKEGEGYEDY